MLRLYDTLTKTVQEIEPITPNFVKMYTCGPTVYRDAHIGNLRSYLLADWIKRSLIFQGVSVLHVKNITDVGHMQQEVLELGGDKIIAAALAVNFLETLEKQNYSRQFELKPIRLRKIHVILHSGRKLRPAVILSGPVNGEMVFLVGILNVRQCH